MNCCPTAEITFLENGMRASENNIQADGVTLQFFPYRAIQTVRYTVSRGDAGVLTVWIATNGTPGGGGLSYRYSFPCGISGRTVFETLLTKL
jgi:hypothetical protein